MTKKNCNCNGNCGNDCKCKMSIEETGIMVCAGQITIFKYQNEKRVGVPIHINYNDITMAFLTEKNQIAIVDIKRSAVLRSSLNTHVTQKLQSFIDGIECHYHVMDSKEKIREILEKAWAASLQKLHDRDKFLEKQKKEKAA